jgi:hypothetical protein
VPTAYDGPRYDLTPPTPSTFTVSPNSAIVIRNVTDDGWFFATAPSTPGTTMFRVSADGKVIDQWGSANFQVDFTGSGRNRIARGESVRITTGNVPLGTIINVDYFVGQNMQRTLPIHVATGLAQLLSITRLDATPTSSRTVHWEVTFDRPVAGVVDWNFGFNNYAAAAPKIIAVDPDAASTFRKWTVTVEITDGLGNGPLALRSQNTWMVTPESPTIANRVTGEAYEINPLVFSVPPNGTIDIENFYADRLYFRAGPAPASAQMFRLSENTIAIDPWGSANFNHTDGSNSNNYVARRQYLRIAAGGTPVNTPIVVRAYRSVLAADTGFEITVHVQVPDAQVMAIDIIDPSPTVANSVRWEATFNKSMTNVTAANFSFINTAQIQPPPTVTSVVPVANSGSTKWRITADTTGTGTGLLGLRYIGHRTETPTAPNTFTGQFYDFSAYPLITQHPTPSSAIMITGSQAPTLTVAATIRTGETLYYQWKKGTPQFASQGQDVAGATSTSFTPPTNVAGHHSYYCHVFTISPNTGRPTGYYAHSMPSVMHVYDPPEIVTQPADIGVAPGASGMVSVGAIGTDLEYQWYVGNTGDRSQPIAASNAANYANPPLTANTRYWVLVWNALGAQYEVASNTVTVRVVKSVTPATVKFTPVIEATLADMKVRALDFTGAPAPGATITFETRSLGHIGGASAGGNFAGAVASGGESRASAVTNADGWATAPAMWTNTKIGDYTVTATLPSPNGSSVSASIAIQNQAGAPAAFTWVRQPSANAVAGVAFASQPSLLLHDAWSNPVSDAVVVARADQALGILQGAKKVQSLKTGAVGFKGLSHHTAEQLRLHISCGDVTTVSDPITVVAGPVALITAAAGTPQGARPGETFAQKLVAKLSDAYGNPVAGQSVRFVSPATGANASFPDGDAAMTDAHGQAKVLAQAGTSSGTYSVLASPVDHTLTEGAVFQLYNFSHLQTWRAENFAGTWENTGDAANGAMPFNDGVPNLLKYAFNLNAKAAEYALMTSDGVKGLPLVALDEYGRLTVTFVRRRSDTYPAISYTAEFTNDLSIGTLRRMPTPLRRSRRSTAPGNVS